MTGTTHMLQYTMPEANERTMFDFVADVHTGKYEIYGGNQWENTYYNGVMVR